MPEQQWGLVARGGFVFQLCPEPEGPAHLAGDEGPVPALSPLRGQDMDGPLSTLSRAHSCALLTHPVSVGDPVSVSLARLR